jgi:hypothetical protein
MVTKFFATALAFFLLAAGSAYSQEKLDAALEAWIKSNGKNVMRQRVLVTSPIDKATFPAVKSLKRNEYFRMLGLSQPSVVNTSLFYKVNNLRPASALEAAKILNMDLAIEIGEGEIRVTHPGSKKSFSIPNAESVDELIANLRKSFGYDGYVVDAKGELILARVTGNLLEKGSQAIIVDSVEQFLSTEEKVGAASLIEMVARKGDFGLFRIILGQSGEAIPAGSRVQFSTR